MNQVAQSSIVRSGSVVLCLLVLVSGCKTSSPEYRDMEQMAEKFRAKVKELVAADRLMDAYRIANASCFFAREMDCVAGHPLRATAGQSDITRVEDASAFKARIEDMVLKPDRFIETYAESYAAAMGEVLTQGEIARLNEIRARFKYWDQLQGAFMRVR